MPKKEQSDSPTKEQLLDEITQILMDHDNMESNIGFGHKYWNLKNELRKAIVEEKNYVPK